MPITVDVGILESDISELYLIYIIYIYMHACAKP